PYRFLSFWVRGSKGRADLTVKLADERWAEKEDSVALATLSDILRRDIGKKWQEVLIPLEPARFRQLDFARLATLAFNFSRRGSGTVYVADVAFLTARETPAARADSSPGARATWIWDPAPILSEEAKQQELFTLARARGLGVLYLQIDASCHGSGERVECQLNNEDALRPFLRQARARGLEVHALDGAPNYSLPTWQPTALARLRAVLDFNRRAEPDERFAGFHHDNEPYLLEAFTGGGAEPLLVNLLELTAASQQLVRQTPEKMVYGVDIPFWYDSRPVTWQGVRKAASLHLLDLVDTASVMAYRTEASGEDGVLALARDEISYAGRLGKRIFVALETAPLPDQAQYTFSLGGPTPETPVSQGAYLLA
ncbi:MAG: hypothetical protein ACRDHY_03260, partial [Anaerolineales bacterium]